MELAKNQEHTVTIEGYGEGGMGVARIDGRVVFVHGALRGEKCRVLILKTLKSVAFAKVLEVLEPSSERITPDCPYFPRCGGCTYRHIRYEEELRLKKQRVQDNLSRIGGSDVTVEEILGAQDTLRYRNKAQYPVSKDGAVGFYRARTHEVIECEHCLLVKPEADAAAEALREYMQSCRVAGYDEKTGRGLVRHLYIRSNAAGESLVCVLVNGDKLPKEDRLVTLLRDACPKCTGIVLGTNTKKGNVILGDRYRTLWGSDRLEDTLCGKTFRLSVPSFYQVNRVQAERLYAKAIEFAGLTGQETVLDLYCGAGTITLALSDHAKKVLGAEIVPEAIDDARENAARNGVKNAEFFCGDASDVAKKLARENLRPDVITVDPPRKGLAADVVESIAEMQPQRVVYVSCDSATMARDVKRLADLGYTAQRACAVDMFPRADHVETVVLLSKGEVDSKKIRVEFSLEDMDMSEFQDGATYTQIKDYVLEHSGLKVSNLYISQIKRKCGIEVGKNYNLPKSEDSRQPMCPPEKEKAIREAFKYFGMI
ncbi:MAG: 23S rRNA (uracil(1939)-C(5))-methyltransferase RlmD [Oscillospiraceae bacterium]|nr:23S rRNA (uracil(1939)-C(5))-methyltransferase RlmD [Oscillospiraceae bacterium]